MSSTILTPELLAKLSGLELQARAVVDGLLAGRHRGPQRGHSIEFAEHREYAPGDDLRYLDWKVYGRSDRNYVKQFESETDAICYLLLDVSESMSYRSQAAALSKLDYAKILTAAMAYLAVSQQDLAACSTISTVVHDSIPPGGHAQHAREIWGMLERTVAVPRGDTQPENVNEEPLDAALHALAERMQRRGIVIVLSDCLVDPESLVRSLRHFRFRRHDVALLHIVDPAEQDFTFAGPTEFLGLERQGGLTVEAHSIASAYRDEFEGFRRDLELNCRNMQIDYHLARTDAACDQVLRRLLKRGA